MEPPGRITIRPACREDAASICDHNRATAEETEGRVLDFSTAWEGVHAIFDDPSKGFYLVAEAGGRIVGQCMVTYEWSDWRCGNFWWIQSVYVIPGLRRKGIFTRIFREVSEMAKREPATVGLRLYVERDNAAALKAYSWLGMQATRYLLLEQEFPGSHLVRPPPQVRVIPHDPPGRPERENREQHPPDSRNQVNYGNL